MSPSPEELVEVGGSLGRRLPGCLPAVPQITYNTVLEDTWTSASDILEFKVNWF